MSRPSSSSESSWVSGALIGGTRYEVQRTLGAGGMGTVYEVRHVDLGLVRALKMLNGSLATRRDLMERLQREAQVLAKLRGHPHLVEVVDFGQTDTGRPFYVMELLTGRTLRQYAERRAIPFPEACNVILQLLSALAPVHQAGVVHRDVKPDNIFLQDNGLCKLLDFGVVKAMVDGILVGNYLTAPGAIVGTTRYVCPEYIGQKAPDSRADIYGAGVVLFELLTGAPPLPELREEDFLAHILREGIPSLEDVNAFAVPEEIRRIVRRATEFDRDQRFASAETFAAELAWALVRLGVGLSAATRTLSTPAPKSAPAVVPEAPVIPIAVALPLVAPVVAAKAARVSSPPLVAAPSAANPFRPTELAAVPASPSRAKAPLVEAPQVSHKAKRTRMTFRRDVRRILRAKLWQFELFLERSSYLLAALTSVAAALIVVGTGLAVMRWRERSPQYSLPSLSPLPSVMPPKLVVQTTSPSAASATLARTAGTMMHSAEPAPVSSLPALAASSETREPPSAFAETAPAASITVLPKVTKAKVRPSGPSPQEIALDAKLTGGHVPLPSKGAE